MVANFKSPSSDPSNQTPNLLRVPFPEKKPTNTNIMNITIPSNATTQSIKTAHPAPRGATHFRLTEPKRKPVIDAIKNLDTLAGCSGKLEYGKVQFEGRGRYAKVKAFTPLATASAPEPEPERVQPVLPPQPAPVEQQPAPATGRPKGAKLNRIMGFSACAVAKSLGKAGVKHEEAARIFLAHGIEMPKASLSVQLGFGRNPGAWERHGKPAELSDTQMAELRTKGVEQ